MKRTCLIAAMVFLIASAARAAEVPAPIAPFVDENTILVARVDIRRIDIDALMELGRKCAVAFGTDEKEFSDAAAVPAAMASGVLENMKKAGIGEIYYLMELNGMATVPGKVIVPLASPEQAKTALPALQWAVSGETNPSDSPFTTAQVIGSSVVLSDEAGIAYAGSIKAKARPDIAAALAAGDAAVKVLFIPSPEIRKVATELLPALPKEIGGGSVERLFRAAEFVSLSLTLPQQKSEASIRLRVHSTDAAGAKDAMGLWEAIKPLIEAECVPGPHQTPEDAFFLQFIQRIAPRVEGAGVTLELDEKKILAAVHGIGPSFKHAQLLARREASRQRAESIVLAIRNLANKEKDKWPDKLDAVVGVNWVSPQMLLSPVDGKTFIYRKPAEEELKRPDNAKTLPVLWESAGKEDVRVVGFADGHADAIDEAAFQKVMKDAGIKPNP